PPNVARKALLVLSNVRLPNSARRARLPPDMIWLNGLNGLNALAGTLVGFSPPANAPPGPEPGSPANRGVFGGATPFKFIIGGIAIVCEPGVKKEPDAPGASSLCVFTFES